MPPIVLGRLSWLMQFSWLTTAGVIMEATKLRTSTEAMADASHVPDGSKGKSLHSLLHIQVGQTVLVKLMTGVVCLTLAKMRQLYAGEATDNTKLHCISARWIVLNYRLRFLQLQPVCFLQVLVPEKQLVPGKGRLMLQ